MKQHILQQIIHWHRLYKEQRLTGRWITFDMIKPIIKELTFPFSVKQIGVSFRKVPIHKITIGSGATKILLWSQMHGNESTGTKALFDLFQFFLKPKENIAIVERILEKCTLVFIPLLNPDGAEIYTRKNAQGIDLNRDAVALEAPESNILRAVLKEFNPQFCFNLHDQRTIFSVGKQQLPASISFLAPSEDKERTVTSGRKVTMAVIVAMNAVLQQIIPNQIGRYTDEFYPTATGDNFQKAGYNTILIEAGHYQDDYDREEVRMLNFIALITGILHITKGVFTNYTPYFNILDNEKKYLDIIYKNVFLIDKNQLTDVGIVYKETLLNGTLHFTPVISLCEKLTDYNANRYIDKKGETYKNEEIFLTSIEK